MQQGFVRNPYLSAASFLQSYMAYEGTLMRVSVQSGGFGLGPRAKILCDTEICSAFSRLKRRHSSTHSDSPVHASRS